LTPPTPIQPLKPVNLAEDGVVVWWFSGLGVKDACGAHSVVKCVHLIF